MGNSIGNVSLAAFSTSNARQQQRSCRHKKDDYRRRKRSTDERHNSLAAAEEILHDAKKSCSMYDLMREGTPVGSNRSSPRFQANNMALIRHHEVLDVAGTNTPSGNSSPNFLTAEMAFLAVIPQNQPSQQQNENNINMAMANSASVVADVVDLNGDELLPPAQSAEPSEMENGDTLREQQHCALLSPSGSEKKRNKRRLMRPNFSWIKNRLAKLDISSEVSGNSLTFKLPTAFHLSLDLSGTAKTHNMATSVSSNNLPTKTANNNQPHRQQQQKKRHSNGNGMVDLRFRDKISPPSMKSSAAATSQTKYGVRRMSYASTGASAFSQISRQNRASRRSDVGLLFNDKTPNQQSTANGTVRTKSIHPIPMASREIIKWCFESPHTEIGTRIFTRLFDKRMDFRNFSYAMGREKWQQLTGRLRDFLDSVVLRIDNIGAVEALSERFGEEHVALRFYGFKPDFWVTLADAITVECINLDQAVHQPSEAITAWSLFVSLLFSAIRDGYYAALREQRISQRHKNQKDREDEVKKTTACKESNRVQFNLRAENERDEHSRLNPTLEANQIGKSASEGTVRRHSSTISSAEMAKGSMGNHNHKQQTAATTKERHSRSNSSTEFTAQPIRKLASLRFKNR